MEDKTFSKSILGWVQTLRDAAAAPRGAVRAGGAPLSSSDTLKPILNDLRKEASAVRSDVIEALSEDGDGLAADVLHRLAGNEADWRLRLKVINSLAKVRIEEGTQGLMEIAKNDIDPEVRCEAIRQLGKRALTDWSAASSRPESNYLLQGAPRTSAAAETNSHDFRPQAQAIVALLKQVQLRDPSADVRRTAHETVAQFHS